MVSRKDISDEVVCRAYAWASHSPGLETAEVVLMNFTNAPIKVCMAAIERAFDRGLVDCGVSLRTGWLTPKGDECLRRAQTEEGPSLNEVALERVITKGKLRISDRTGDG